MDINDVVRNIIAQCNGTLLSEIKTAPSDVDIYIPINFKEIAIFLLDSEKFICTWSGLENTVYRKFLDGKLYVIDLISDFNVYAKFQPFYKFTEYGSKNIGRSPLLHRHIKDFSFNKDLSFFREGAGGDLVCHFFQDSLNYKVRFIRPLSDRDYASVSNISYRLREGCWRAFLVFLIKLNAYFSLIGKGKAVAFLGPDGAGKSYYIDRLMLAGRTRRQYMGDWFFTFQFFYNYLLKLPSPFNRAVYVFYFFENMGRLAYVNFLKIIGYIVLIDRYPGTGQNVLQTGFLKKVNDFIFWIFKKPTLFILLSAPPQEIYARKQELSIEEISNITISLKEKISPYNHVIVETTDSDFALNLMMKRIFSFLKINGG